ncbi:glycosyltransferase family 4 protein [Fusobacterium varium]|uniref:glycosyltransferase family 4 protein n=1 Tax=Fusobacterium varium TaxID=856 RepID=UPI000E41D8C0|nr:glycosyltransferase family 1 protein [Fusobacterium varium]MDY4006926.1 glycosyltransferase family 1 protein [Fusobacterium varium]RGJ28885.1 glycosyltransferase family 1 protein [Fusobacterium varium]
MKIAIDCRMINSSGIGTYLSAILPYMLEEKHKFLLIGCKEKLIKFGKKDNVEILNCDIKIFSLKEFLFFPTKQINNCDIYYTPNFNIPKGIKIPIYSTILDVIFLDMPELTSKIGYLIRKYFYKRTYKLSKKIFTVSEFSKNRIEHFLGNKKEIIVTFCGISDFILEKLDEEYVKKDYLIFVGNIKKHKGLKILLEAFMDLKKEGYPYKLIIVGEQNNFKTKDREVLKILENLKLNKDIIFTGYVNNKELRKLIAEARILIQPSLYEGFGIPPLEALVLGTDVILSDIEVFKEIYSDLPVSFFRVNNVNELKKIILEKKGKEFFKSFKQNKYSYKNTSKIILKILLGEKNG